MSVCTCHQVVWHIVGPIPACPVHDLCGRRGCGCGHAPCARRFQYPPWLTPEGWVPPGGPRYGVITLTAKELEKCREASRAFFKLVEPEWDTMVLRRFAQVMAVVAYAAETDRQGLWPATLKRVDSLLAQMWPCQRAFVEKPHPMLAWIRR